MYSNDKLVSSLCYLNDQYICNVCTPTEYRRCGYQKQLFRYAINWIIQNLNKYDIYLFTENDTRGDIPKLIYKKQGWLTGLKDGGRTKHHFFACKCDELIKPIILPCTITNLYSENNMKYLSSLFSCIFDETISFIGDKINLESILLNDNNILYNHVYLLDEFNQDHLLNSILPELFPKKRVFLCICKLNEY